MPITFTGAGQREGNIYQTPPRRPIPTSAQAREGGVIQYPTAPPGVNQAQIDALWNTIQQSTAAQQGLIGQQVGLTQAQINAALNQLPFETEAAKQKLGVQRQGALDALISNLGQRGVIRSGMYTTGTREIEQAYLDAIAAAEQGNLQKANELSLQIQQAELDAQAQQAQIGFGANQDFLAYLAQLLGTYGASPRQTSAQVR